MQIIAASWNNGNPTPEFNNAAQIFNHEFYWESMSPNGGGRLFFSTSIGMTDGKCKNAEVKKIFL